MQKIKYFDKNRKEVDPKDAYFVEIIEVDKKGKILSSKIAYINKEKDAKPETKGTQ